MTCRSLASFLHDYLGGVLPPKALAAFEGHLAVCPNCVRYLAQYRSAVEIGKDAFVDPDAVPPEVPEDLVKAVLSTVRR